VGGHLAAKITAMIEQTARPVSNGRRARSAGPRPATSLLVVLAILAGVSVTRAGAAPDFASYVKPFNGTKAGAPDFGTGGGAANTFPGPVLPLGMIQWSPDTSPSTANVGGGYAYDDTTIRGFSVRHLSGAGCPNEGDVPFLPTTKPITASPVDPLTVDYRSSFLPSFSHADEDASAGYYRVGLNPKTPARINAELTATTRSGLGRFTFPATDSSSVLINATGSKTGNKAGSVTIDPARHEVSGSTSSGGFCVSSNTYKLYFVATFSRPFAAYGTWTQQSLAPGSTSAHDSLPIESPIFTSGPRYGFGLPGQGPTAQTGAYITFDTTKNHLVEVRVGISFVSVGGARKNLLAETKGLAFDAIRQRARNAWNRMLGKIEVSGGRLDDRRTFYSMMYHALIGPSVFSDVDGRYIGFDHAMHVARGYTQYSDFSGWDVYRSQIPLLALVAPKQASDFATSLLADQRQSGWLPKWSVANGHTDVMTGDPAPPSLAHILALGAKNFDARAALAASIKGATQSGTSPNGGYVERQAVGDYQRLGYVPFEKNASAITGVFAQWLHDVPIPLPSDIDLAWGSAATTLEYATADFAVARLAAAVGDTKTCRTFLARAANWRNVFDPSIGYVRPRWGTGQWVSNYDPNSNDQFSSHGFVEGDGAQYTWMVPQDPAGLFAALGGKKRAKARLDQFFSELNAGMSSPHAFLGNEPNSNAPWLYDWIGEPYKAQSIMRRAILGMFNAGPGGYPGNDDLGQMSAWYVFGALGFYPAIPGSDVLALGSPLFPKAVLHLSGGDLVITAPSAARDAPYVHGLTMNGARYDKPWLRLRQVLHGAALAFTLGRSADSTWGTNPASAPPSFGPKAASGCSP
jgi:predicted alpha-1,2-mannosidase